MTAVPRFLVDPLLVTVPPATAGAEAAQGFLLALESWLREVQASGGDSWGHFLECTHRLQMAQRFPNFRTIRQAIRIAGLDLNAEQLVYRLAAFFEDDRRDFSAHTTTRCVVSDPEAHFDPEALILRNLPDLQAELAAALLCIAADRALGVADARSCHLVTRPIGDARLLRITARAALTDPDAILRQLPAADIDQQIPLLVSPTDLCDLLQPEVILGHGPAAFLQAVRLRAERQREDRAPLLATVGPAFWPSIEKSTLCTSLAAMDKLLWVSVLLVLDQASTCKGILLRQFRESADPNAKQQRRARDGAAAWRVTLVKQGIGWRMNYWLVPGPPPQVEFAIIQKKQDVEHIPE